MTNLEKEWNDYFEGEGKDPTTLLNLLWEQNKEAIEKRIAGGSFPVQPKRAWVGLTDDEHTEIQKQTPYTEFMSPSGFAARCQAAVEAKLKEKNT